MVVSPPLLYTGVPDSARRARMTNPCGAGLRRPRVEYSPRRKFFLAWNLHPRVHARRGGERCIRTQRKIARASARFIFQIRASDRVATLRSSPEAVLVTVRHKRKRREPSVPGHPTVMHHRI